MSISVVKAGLLDSIQDMGRYGYGKWGINAGGVMDAFAARVANMLVGNCSGEPLLEIHFPGPQILFEQNALVSICGADFSPMVNDEYIPLWKPVVVRRNTVLHFPKLNRGARCYLAVHGGFCVDQWLGSGGTHLRAGAGGWKSGGGSSQSRNRAAPSRIARCSGEAAGGKTSSRLSQREINPRQLQPEYALLICATRGKPGAWASRFVAETI